MKKRTLFSLLMSGHYIGAGTFLTGWALSGYNEALILYLYCGVMGIFWQHLYSSELRNKAKKSK